MRYRSLAYTATTATLLFYAGTALAEVQSVSDRAARLSALLQRIEAEQKRLETGNTIAPTPPSSMSAKQSLTLADLAAKVAAERAQTGAYDVFVGGVKFGVVILNGDTFSREVKVGSCTSRKIGEHGEYKVDRASGRIDILPEAACLSSTVLNLRNNQEKLKFVDSNSAYLNFAGTTTDAADPTISLAGGVYVGGHYIYSDAILDTDKNLYTRGDSYIAKDVPSLYSRLTVGDVTSDPSSSLVSTERIGGIQFNRNWAQDPVRQEQVYWTPSHKLRLNSRSTVEIFRDGQLVDQRIMDAGEYDVRGLPTAGYATRLKYRITDVYGNVQEVVADAISPPRILRNGEVDYSAAFGVKRELVRKGAGDYTGGPTGGGNIAYGVSDWLTAGGGVQDKAVVLSAAVATPIGFISGEGRVDSIGDYRAAWSYSLADHSFGAEYAMVEGKGRTTGDYGLSMGRLGSLSLRYSQYADQDPVTGARYSLNLPKNYALLGGVDVNAKTKDVGYSAGLFKVFNPRLTVQVAYNKSTNNDDSIMGYLSFALDRSAPASVGFRANTTVAAGQPSFSTTTEGRYGLYASVGTSTPANGGPTATTATVAGGIGYADGMVRVGEPVSGAFVVGDGLDVNTTKGGLVSVSPYFNTNVVSSTRVAADNKVVALRPGQGMRLSVKDWISVKARVEYADGTPVKGVKVNFPGGETVTGSNGLLWIDHLQKKLTTIQIGGQKVMLALDVEDKDGKVDVGVLKIQQQPVKNANAKEGGNSLVAKK